MIRGIILQFFKKRGLKIANFAMLLLIFSCHSLNLEKPYCKKLSGEPSSLEEAKEQIGILIDCVEDLESLIEIQGER